MPETRHRVVTETRKNTEAPLRFDASLSSEYAYLRGYGYEVLSHEPGAINMERAGDGLPLLVQHDHDRPVGMVENVRVLGRKLRASIRFFTTEAGREAATMVEEGLRALSVGYQVESTKQTGARDGVPVYTVDRWTPFECSLVSVPADPSVGIGRSAKPTFQGKPTMNPQDEAPEVTVEPPTKPEGSDRRTQDIIAIGQMFARHGGEARALEALRTGKSVEQFRQSMLKHMPTQPFPTADVGHVNSRRGDRYSLRNLILSVADPAQYGHLAGFEREMSQESERRYGTRAQGLFVPDDVLFKRDLATTLNGGASAISNTLRPDLLAEFARPRARVIEAGARVLTGLSGNIRIPRQTAGASVGWQTEQGTATETDVTLDELNLTPKRLTAFIEVSRQQLVQGSFDVEAMLQSDLLRAADAMIDSVAINGSGTANQPKGIRNTSGIGAVVGGANGATVTWSHVVDLEAQVAQANVSFDRPGYLINAPTRAWLRKTPRGTNLDFILPGQKADEPLNSYPLWVSNNVPSNLTKGTSVAKCSSVIFSGDWSELIIARFGDSEIIVDPYTRAKDATVVITLNLFVDIGVRKPAAFATMEDALTA